jgi:hypothetical protein
VGNTNIELLAFVVCESVSVDVRTGNATLQSLFDTIHTPGVPALKQSMSVFFRIKVDDPTASLSPSLSFNLPSGLKTMMQTLPPLNVSAAGLAQSNINIQGMIFTEFGTYEIELYINQVKMAGCPIMVQRQGAATSGSEGQRLHQRLH